MRAQNYLDKKVGGNGWYWFYEEYINKALEMAYIEGMFSTKETRIKTVEIGNKKACTLIHDPTGLRVDYVIEVHESTYRKMMTAEQELKELILSNLECS